MREVGKYRSEFSANVRAYYKAKKIAEGRAENEELPFSKLFELTREIDRLERELQETKTESLRSPLKLSNSDFQLCLIWGGVKRADLPPVLSAYKLVSKLGEYEAHRLLCARAAEIATNDYYTELRHTVEDVSIGQLHKLDNRWIDYDLLVDGRPIDVKNARRSFSNPNSYVEHAVPKFKRARDSGLEVSIVGVLSDDYLEGHTGFYEILGEVRLTDIKRLNAWMCKRFGHLVNVDGMWKPDFQPGWVFEYPSEHYALRAHAIRAISAMLENAVATGLSAGDIPGWLITLCTDEKIIESINLSPERKRVWTDLNSLAIHLGPTRPDLYLYVMGYVLEAMTRRLPAPEIRATLIASLFKREPRSDRHETSSERRLRLLIRNSDDPRSRPLGLHDPEEYVFSLMDALMAVYEEAITQNIDFVAFKLVHPAILRAQNAQGKWVTILAYCGGRRQVDAQRLKCGMTPLYLGKNAVCESCGYLVCEECGFCSSTCDSVMERQRTRAKEWRDAN